MENDASNYSADMSSSGDSRVTYARDLVGHIEYRSSKPIHAYQQWSVDGIGTVVNAIAMNIRHSAGDLAQFKHRVNKQLAEKELYDPLQNIFRTIEGAAADITGYKRSQFRQLVAMHEHVPDAENMSFPISKPDFVLAEVPPTSEYLTAAVDVDTIKWRQICGFVEVKTVSRDGPNPNSRSSPTSVKTIVSQGANYARLILAARPFQLYVLCVFIYGTNFCLGWYDRRGAIISDDYDIDNNLDIFIRVVLQLTTHMSSYQLGHDVTARLLEGHSYYQDKYPSFLVSLGGDGNTIPRWETSGPPIWSSLSLLGRGTATWQAISLRDKQNVVLKTLWRSQTRYSEADVYNHIESDCPGIAKLSCGDDVRYVVCKETNARVTVGFLRSFVLDDRDWQSVRDDPVLHRITITPVGRPLWDAKTSEEFILGSLAALKGHERLVNQGIIHRDMSPGNTYLGKPGCPNGWEGFIADLELASIAKVTEVEAIERPLTTGQLNKRFDFQEKTVLSSSKAPGAEITGTALFMARELLQEMLSSPAGQKSKHKVHPAKMERGVHHDLESFILVLFYAAMKRGLESKAWDKHPEVDRIRKLYCIVFGGHTIDEIITGRMRLVNPKPDCLFDALDEPMFHLLFGCRSLLQHQYADLHNSREDEINRLLGNQQRRIITYGELYGVYNVAIHKFVKAQ